MVQIDNQTSEKLYEYKKYSLGEVCSETFVCQGRKAFVEQFIRRREVSDVFNGFILSLNTETNEEFLGVWGKRNCQKFRRILRERGANFELVTNAIVPGLQRGITATQL